MIDILHNVNNNYKRLCYNTKMQKEKIKNIIS